MQVHLKYSQREEIQDDITKGERNRNPTKNQYSIPCTYFEFGNCTKKLCVSKKCWDIRPRNSEWNSNQIYMLWSNHFKALYDTNKIPHLVFNMAYNHLCILYFHHILKHGGNNHPYFDYDKKIGGLIGSRLMLV